MGYYIARDNDMEEHCPYIASNNGFNELENFIYASIFNGDETSDDYPALSYFLKEGYSAEIKDLKQELKKILPKAPAPSAIVIGKLIEAIDESDHEITLIM